MQSQMTESEARRQAQQTAKATRKLNQLIALLCQHSSPSVRFFGMNCACMTRRITDNFNGQDVPTMATDGRELMVNPDFLLSNSENDNLFILIHEAFHKVAQHSFRLRNVPADQQELMHMAADYAVNLALYSDDSIPFTIPPNGLLDTNYVDRDGKPLNAERIFDFLLKQKQQAGGKPQPRSEKAAMKKTGDLLPAKKGASEMQDKFDIAKTETLCSPGEMPDYLKSLIQESIDDSDESWIERFRQLLATTFSKSDYSLRKPNNRYRQFGIYPSLRSPAINNIAIAIDTSGSMDERQLNEAARQMKLVIDEWGPQKVTIVQHDAVIQYEEELHAGMEPQMVQFHGRGGTKFKPVFDYFEADRPDALVWLTDMGACDMGKFSEPDYPVIFCSMHPNGKEYHRRMGEFGHFVDLYGCELA